MTRAKISEYSATAGDNTDVNGVDIAEGCPPSSMNNMGREIMAALKRFQVGSDGDPVTIGGQLAVTGTTTTSPAIVAAGDTNTGIFFPAADTIAFAEGGAEAMRIDSSGNVGIGTSSPAAKAEVYGTAAASNIALRITNTATDGFSTIQLGDANAGIYRNGSAQTGYAGAGSLNLITVGANNIGFSTNNGLRVIIDSSGNVGIGTTSTGTSRLVIKSAGSTAGTTSLSCENSSATSQLFLRDDNYFNSGAIANYSVAGTGLVIDGSNYVGKTTSSLRYKKDIVDYDKGLTAIESLRPVYYKSAVEGPNGVDPKQHAGFVAEEIADAGFEEFLVRDSEGRPDAVQYAHITALLVKSIQELKAELDEAKARIAALEAVPGNE